MATTYSTGWQVANPETKTGMYTDFDAAVKASKDAGRTCIREHRENGTSRILTWGEKDVLTREVALERFQFDADKRRIIELSDAENWFVSPVKKGSPLVIPLDGKIITGVKYISF